MRNVIFVVFLLGHMFFIMAQTSKMEQNLHTGWKFRSTSQKDWFPAQIPGNVHMDLMNNKLITEPYYRDNERKLQWIENEDWEYQTYFDIDPNLYSKNNIEIQLKGLDTYADVYLNDTLILEADNMFRSWSYNCKKLLKPRNNDLRIVFHSAVKEGVRKAKQCSYRLPNHNEKITDSLKCGSQTRKSPHQFGWDTHPRLVTCGIWQPITLLAWEDAILENNYVRPVKIESKIAEYSIITSIKASAEKNYAVSVYINNESHPQDQKKVKLKKGSHQVQLHLPIQNPEFWWPNGMGKPHMYDVRVVLSDEKGKLDEENLKLGVRTIEIIRDPDSIGRSFYFKVNGIPLFIRGSNHVPLDALPIRTTEKQYKSMFQAVKESNINLLRVWGGAHYESDLFYDLCAENGILVWQDFMYACSMYPGDSSFLANIRQETIEVIKRLRNNTALALWCGNNELVWGWKEWGWPHDKRLNISKSDSARIFQDYLKIFDTIIPSIIKEYNPETFYWPSSPGAEPNMAPTLQSGDYHYYSVWYGGESIQRYKKVIPRFMSEYGVQSFPAYSTLQKYFAPEDMDLFSPIMMFRQKSVMPGIAPDMEGNKMLMRYILEEYNQPKDFESLVYLSQLFQADALKIATEAHRINKPVCMGTMYWQFGDAWPNVGWSVIDYLGRKKAAYYTAKKAFSNIVVIPALSDGDEGKNSVLNVYVNSDSAKAIQGNLYIKLMDFNGNIHFEKKMEITVHPLSNEIVFTLPVKDLLNNKDKNALVLSAAIETQGRKLTENLLYFNHTKYLNLPQADIQTTIKSRGEQYEIELSARSLAKGVYLSLPDGEGDFSDNFFDLLPGESVTIFVSSRLPMDDVRKNLTMRSVIDSF